MENESFPADVLLIQSSDPKGECFIETKNLDGETNLKFKKTQTDIRDKYENITKISSNYGYLKYEAPNPYLYKYLNQII